MMSSVMRDVKLALETPNEWPAPLQVLERVKNRFLASVATARDLLYLSDAREADLQERQEKEAAQQLKIESAHDQEAVQGVE